MGDTALLAPRPDRCEAPLKIGKSMSSCFSRAHDDCVVVVAAAVINTRLDTIATSQVSLPDKEQVMKYATIGCSSYMIGALTFFAHIVCLLTGCLEVAKGLSSRAGLITGRKKRTRTAPPIYVGGNRRTFLTAPPT